MWPIGRFWRALFEGDVQMDRLAAITERDAK